jgi:hypothetical protein
LGAEQNAPKTPKREVANMETKENLSTGHWQSNISQSRSESLKRAVSRQSFSNFPAIFQGFAAKEIPESDIKPRENVFTFEAWKALGRVVRRGEHAVKVVTFIESKNKEIDGDMGEPIGKTYKSNGRPFGVVI